MEASQKTEDAIQVIPDQHIPDKLNFPPDHSFKFFRKGDQYNLLHGHQYQLKNSLLAAVGFFELANAGDFAANVWNEYPVPRYATALMAIGGTCALFMTYFAYRDARLSWRNIQGLRLERRSLLRFLKEQQRSNNNHGIRTVNALLDVNHRETGNEIIDRVGLDIAMGFGATMVGVGTLMAIGGANHSVFLASNLLSGYIGNAPLGLYGLVNLVWSIYVWIRARRHHIAYHPERLPGVDVDPIVGKLLKARIDAVQTHAMLNGITGVVAGGASLVTSTMWWGYVVLIPCIIISIIANYSWRHGLGYDRPLVVEALPTYNEFLLTEELKYIACVRRAFPPFTKKSPASLSGLVSDPESIGSIVEFMARNELLENFCIRLLQDKELSSIIINLDDTTVTIQPSTLVSVSDGPVQARLVTMAHICISELGPRNLRSRERFLLEVLGCYMMATSIVKPKTEKSMANMA